MEGAAAAAPAADDDDKDNEDEEEAEFPSGETFASSFRCFLRFASSLSGAFPSTLDSTPSAVVVVMLGKALFKPAPLALMLEADWSVSESPDLELFPSLCSSSSSVFRFASRSGLKS